MYKTQRSIKYPGLRLLIYSILGDSICPHVVRRGSATWIKQQDDEWVLHCIVYSCTLILSLYGLYLFCNKIFLGFKMNVISVKIL